MKVGELILSQMLQSNSSLTSIIFRKFINFLGFMGIVFILYGLVSDWSEEKWPLLESWAGPLSSGLTIAGTLLTASSIYFFKPGIHKPERFSKFFSAPIVIAAAAFAIIVLINNGSISPIIVNGFALLGVSGALFRIQRRPNED